VAGQETDVGPGQTDGKEGRRDNANCSGRRGYTRR
jgi:hypothetical protein